MSGDYAYVFDEYVNGTPERQARYISAFRINWCFACGSRSGVQQCFGDDGVVSVGVVVAGDARRDHRVCIGRHSRLSVQLFCPVRGCASWCERIACDRYRWCSPWFIVCVPVLCGLWVRVGTESWSLSLALFSRLQLLSSSRQRLLEKSSDIFHLWVVDLWLEAVSAHMSPRPTV